MLKGEWMREYRDYCKGLYRTPLRDPFSTRKQMQRNRKACLGVCWMMVRIRGLECTYLLRVSLGFRV